MKLGCPFAKKEVGIGFLEQASCFGLLAGKLNELKSTQINSFWTLRKQPLLEALGG